MLEIFKMTVRSHSDGHEIYLDNGKWKYADTQEEVVYILKFISEK